ncbi:methyltransferase [Photorhabdus laumondii subsp. laumondii]|uniref:Photorhabdus luminescens subsp. laumondii TTO1 complete genome segment 17/17 n=3 Tax=Photorhabdus laumondii subsp. laumondii TaxID=141679 RepID=Q7MY07_PHOLL|nr:MULTISPECIES: methyltransferase [Photorhabdus]AWK44376.1 methyltransferase [Photorhabdus laumondii subsp. laumondii]AXG49688.1 methyltransferase [Photorhabdus laumondii subsp. laumondii]KTL62125.1 methyltransferase [Photorhabdus laumondii subsp. laumondii]MCC8386491.1 methyltransferase [Photorhabdus laumondii]MCC8415728.1 methyltransferase [Photorhabdus laumondii]
MLIDLITSCRKSTVIYAFVDMGLSVHFKDGACVNISELASQYGLDHSRFSRLCEYLIKIGVLVSCNEGVALSEECSALADPESMESLMIRCEVSPEYWKAWSMYSKSLYENNSKTAFEIAHGKPFFEYLDHHELFRSNFDSFMSKNSDKIIEKLLDIYDFSQHNRILDVGGGEGNLLIRINEKIKGKHYAVLDRYNETPVLEDIEFINGDFFKLVPSGYDLYILKNVIHNWSDSNAILILENCRKAMDDNATILLIGTVKKLKLEIIDSTDILMDVLLLGKERYLNELEDLAHQAGFVVKDIKEINEKYSIIELGVK